VEADVAVASDAEVVLGARGDAERQRTSLQALERARRAVPSGDDDEFHDLEAGARPGRALVFA
jgi:hypothetical protein